jgi:hypothetical protein
MAQTAYSKNSVALTVGFAVRGFFCGVAMNYNREWVTLHDDSPAFLTRPKRRGRQNRGGPRY